MNTIQPDLLLDVRPILEKGGSPCGAIDAALEKFQPGQTLVLLVPFEPKPLLARLGREGFSHVSRQVPDGSWRVEFKKDTAAEPIPEAIQLNVRGLEPPEPLVKTLEAVARLKKGQRLRMLSDRKPMHLFPELERRGFSYDCTEQPDQSYVTEIQHAG